MLVPLLETCEGLALLFTVRAAHLRRHAGQVSFPGGRIEMGEGVVAAALRETFEEVGLRVTVERVLGFLEDRVSPTGLVATPVVAHLAWPCPTFADPREVAEIFTLSLSELMAAEPTFSRVEQQGVTRHLVAYQVGERRVWGLTGMVVYDLLERLRAGGMP